MFIVKETVKEIQYGQIAVGVTAVRVVDTDKPFTRGILLRAAGVNDPVPNTNVIWVGGSTVTSSDGMPIAPGEALTVPLAHGKDLYAISTLADQKLAWLGA